ncbi:LytTR family transcriptional regulator [Ligilactobacillus salivarius]|uniref:LytTR family DNA-binding domain-containing protein n=1 Tax=Ligilactobacillus salivarius TaxID=1624 RepID=UPI001786C3A6|nr:LytTR family DNA-binding domain-containing protein [Ligilactobacillus salivarius]QXL49408.1 LytTR family transcriptional regulator [Ligilactobacillus salivarius]UXI84794.1 LytTR family transcriptional regulator [Ligilactobacillus salivarius]
MKVNINIDENLVEDRAEFYLQEMTDKITRIAKELTNDNSGLWCYKNKDIIPVKYEEIILIQSENNIVVVYTNEDSYEYRGRLYQVKDELPNMFIEASRSAIFNYRKIDHLEILGSGMIDVILEKQMRVGISRRKIRILKERLGL